MSTEDLSSPEARREFEFRQLAKLATEIFDEYEVEEETYEDGKRTHTYRNLDTQTAGLSLSTPENDTALLCFCKITDDDTVVTISIRDGCDPYIGTTMAEELGLKGLGFLGRKTHGFRSLATEIPDTNQETISDRLQKMMQEQFGIEE